jgi:molybdopterin/thiamine biosynthesis adenylyltransferase
MRHLAQINLPQIGPAGQAKLEHANILIVGLGALGSVVAELLCRAGVRDLTLCDYDIIEESNLQRQGLYQSTDLGRLKVEVAKERLIAIDPMCVVAIVPEPFSEKIDLHPFTLIIDGTDSLETRLLLNDSARKANLPLIIGTAAGTTGMVFVVQGSPCWQCVTLGKRATDDCDSGVLGMATHLVATLQASAAVRVSLGYATKELIEVDAWNFEIRKIHVKPNAECAACAGTYQYLRAPVAMRFCASTAKVLAKPNKPRLIDLDKVRSSSLIRKDYGTAVLVELDQGTALVHKHGTIEFSNVTEDKARAFVKKIEN